MRRSPRSFPIQRRRGRQPSPTSWLPFAKRGEQDQGILRLAGYSLRLVACGYFIALLIGTPLGFCLGLSKTFTKMADPIIRCCDPFRRWLVAVGTGFVSRRGKNALEYGALFTIAICAMWPTVLNTAAVGVRAIPQDYLNVAKVLKLSRTKTLFKVLIPATCRACSPASG